MRGKGIGKTRVDPHGIVKTKERARHPSPERLEISSGKTTAINNHKYERDDFDDNQKESTTILSRKYFYILLILSKF